MAYPNMDEWRKHPEYKELLVNIRKMQWKRERFLEMESSRLYELYGCGERADTEERVLRERTLNEFWNWLQSACCRISIWPNYKFPIYEAMTAYMEALSAPSTINTASKAKDMPEGMEQAPKRVFGIQKESKKEGYDGKGVEKTPTPN